MPAAHAKYAAFRASDRRAVRAGAVRPENSPPVQQPSGAPGKPRFACASPLTLHDLETLSHGLRRSLRRPRSYLIDSRSVVASSGTGFFGISPAPSQDCATVILRRLSGQRGTAHESRRPTAIGPWTPQFGNTRV